MGNLDKVISFETDAIFATCELPVTVSEDLGAFELTIYNNFTYLMSGMYFAELADGSKISKTRGIDKCKCSDKDKPCECGSLTREKVMEAYTHTTAIGREILKRTKAIPDDYRVDLVLCATTRFIGAGLALQSDGQWEKWRTWITSPSYHHLTPRGKRVHHGTTWGEELGVQPWEPQCSCKIAEPLMMNFWHETVQCIGLEFGKHSCEYPVLWINPDENMTQLEELRESSGEQYQD
jgi:hypothetical protein